MANAHLHQAAAELGVPVRFVKTGSASEMASSAVPQPLTSVTVGNQMAIAVAEQPLDAERIGRGRGRVAVIGLAPALRT